MVITGVGLVTAIGDNAESSAASLDCGLSAMKTIGIPDKSRNELIGCPAIEVGVKYVHARRLWSFALRAARDAVAAADLTTDVMRASRCHLLWTLAAKDRVGYGLQPQGKHISDFVTGLGLSFADVASYEVPFGHASAIAALSMASEFVSRDDRAICLIGGADTLIQLRVLRWLERSRRLKTEIWPDGLIPGEAGAFLLVESPDRALRRGARPICSIERVHFKAVEAKDLGVHDRRAERLTKALRAALPPDPTERQSVERIYCDLNGENVRALEWGLASVRVMDSLGLNPEVVHPADCVGDVGAVSAAMNIGLGALWIRQAAAGTRFMVFAASETGERGVLTAARSADCPSPQPRLGRSNSAEFVDVLVRTFDEAAFLWSLRQHRLGVPDSTLRELTLLDRRVTAHIRALVLGGDDGQAVVDRALGSPPDEDLSPGEVFAVAVNALHTQRTETLDRLFERVESLPRLRAGLLGAFEWIPTEYVQKGVRELLAAQEPLKREAGLVCCAVGGADPGAVLDNALLSTDPAIRAAGARVIGECGLTCRLAACLEGLADAHNDCRCWAAISSVLLGHRGVALEHLRQIGLSGGPMRARAFALALQAMPLPAAHTTLQAISRDPSQVRLLILGSGIAGDPKYVPWLIRQMAENVTSRVAGESFSLITGEHLASLDLDRRSPEDYEAGPNDNPDDPNVDMDPDDGLPWPVSEKVQAWWDRNSSRFQPGVRYFMGAPVTREHCIDVLKNGYQRQRILAADYLCLLNPGTPLFNAGAPASRQQRLLATMT